MKKRILILTALLMAVVGTAYSQNLVREYRQTDLQVDLWVDRDDGTYYAGDPIEIYFQVNADAHVAIYSVDTRGTVNLIFPVEPWEDGFVRAGEVYVLPRQQDDFDLVVRGPEGTEYIQAIASRDYLEIPDWFEGSGVQCEPQDDRDKFIDYVNGRYFESRGRELRAFDLTSIYIHAPRYYSRPVYVQEPWHGTYGAVVYVDYPYGGEVYIDGIFIGYAPLYIPRVYIGYHIFTIYDRWGYCWERNYYVYHDHVIFLDRTLVRTNKYTVSRYKDIRTQTRKYPRSKLTYSTEEITQVRTKYSHATTKNVRSKTGSPGTYDVGGKRTTIGGSKKGSYGSKTVIGSGGTKKGTLGKFGSDKSSVTTPSKRDRSSQSGGNVYRSDPDRSKRGATSSDTYKSGASKRSAPSTSRTPTVKSPSSTTRTPQSGRTSTKRGSVQRSEPTKKSTGSVQRSRPRSTSRTPSAPRSTVTRPSPSSSAGKGRISSGSSSAPSRSRVGSSPSPRSTSSAGKRSGGSVTRGGKKR
jgi:hypothetical protein